jgi:Ca2+/Na+ antiporter
MIKNHVIMIFNAAILIIIGIYGYFSSGSPTALIAPAIGLILLGLSFPTKNEKHIAAHIAVILTLIASAAFLIIGIRRGNALVITMGIITFICFDLYVLNFILRKRQREKLKE